MNATTVTSKDPINSIQMELVKLVTVFKELCRSGEIGICATLRVLSPVGDVGSSPIKPTRVNWKNKPSWPSGSCLENRGPM